MNNIEKYEAVIGLEVHAQLLTNSKAYSSEENTYGANPNTKTCPISLGHPGTLPVANSKVIDYAIKMGIAIGSKIRKVNEYARKNYFYADLPKGFLLCELLETYCCKRIFQFLAKLNAGILFGLFGVKKGNNYQ